MGTNTNITHQFTYACPNEEFSLDDSNGITVNATYTGPDKIWTFIDENTRKLVNLPAKTEADDGETFPAPVGYTKVFIDPTENPLIAGMVLPGHVAIDDDIQTIVEQLPEGETHEYQTPLEITVAYDIFETIYNEDGSWTTSYTPPFITWEDIIKTRNGLLSSSDVKVAPDMPDSVKQPWIDYRQKLRDLPVTWDGIDPHKVQFPTSPDDE